MYLNGVAAPPVVKARRGLPFSSITPLAWVAFIFSATMSRASSQLISTQPGSSCRPFFGLVRFMGRLMRSGLYSFCTSPNGLTQTLPSAGVLALKVEIGFYFGGNAVNGLDGQQVGAIHALVAIGGNPFDFRFCFGMHPSFPPWLSTWMDQDKV